MDFRPASRSDAAPIESLFTSVFSDSEGKAEGARIGRLSRDLLQTTDPGDLFVFVAAEGDGIAGCIIATRLPSQREQEIFLIAPVAIATGHQGRGLGQGLIRHGIEAMRQRGVKVLVTYGDPGFYSKVGFAPVTPGAIEPPFRLSQPEGWLAQTSDGKPIAGSLGKCSCVAAFADPSFW